MSNEFDPTRIQMKGFTSGLGTYIFEHEGDLGINYIKGAEVTEGPLLDRGEEVDPIHLIRTTHQHIDDYRFTRDGVTVVPEFEKSDETSG